MKEVRILAATGMLGSGFREESLLRGLEWGADFIGCDAGSTDGGPYYLGAGAPYFSDRSIARDLRLMIRAGQRAGIPVIIGSAGFAGADRAVDQLAEQVAAIAEEEDLQFRLGLIYSEQSPRYLIDRLREGKIEPLGPSTEQLTEEVIGRSAHIVGMAGTEPFTEALEAGAEVIVAGRSSDTSIYAAIPVLRGISPASAWHAAKILECGAASVKQRKYPDCLFAIVDDEGFTVEPPNPEYACSPLSVASHNLYENGSPFMLREPAGTLHTDTCRYEAVSERAVRVTGQRFVPSGEYTVKLEGAELVGYQSLFFGAVRDPMIIRQLDRWLDDIRKVLGKRYEEVYGSGIDERYQLNVRRFGVDAAMGPMEPTPIAGHEVGLVFEIVADEQELANELIKTAAHIALHNPIPEWNGLISALAYPYSPPELERGPVYRFNMNHVVKPSHYREMFRVETRELSGKQRAVRV